jgi:hypothetical protein
MITPIFRSIPFLIFSLLKIFPADNHSSGTFNKPFPFIIKVFDDDKNAGKFSDKLILTKVVPLETTNDFLISQSPEIQIFENVYYVFDHNQESIILFNSNGKFIRKLGKKGKGPAEYINLNDFQIINKNKIAILSSRKIIYYDSTFTFLKSIDIKSNDKNVYLFPLRFREYNEKYYLWQCTSGYDQNKDQTKYLMYSWKDGNIIKGFFPITEKVPETQRISLSQNRILINTLFESNIIYAIDNDSLSPSYIIDFGRFTITDKILKTNTRKQIVESGFCYNIGNVFETNDYLYFTYLQNFIPMNVLYSKKTRKIVKGKISGFTFMRGVDKEQLISVNEAVMFKADFNRFDISDKLKQTLKSLNVNEFDNPVILRYSINPF